MSSLYPSQELRRRTMAWAVKLHVNPRVVRVQEMKRKWGSCSSSGTVSLASDLVDQDPQFQDYVILHELLHLRGHVHGRVFTALMTAYLPRWRSIRARYADPRAALERGGDAGFSGYCTSDHALSDRLQVSIRRNRLTKTK
jgi:predicted metal-dependent hydrolase